jgi:tetratricopeptide (TPR) repeat protein
LVFGQTTAYQFVNFDDGCYVYDNPQISGGFSARGIAWVFTHEHGANWHPLTGLSHIVDCQIYGLNAGGHHLTNVLLHAATVVTLFLVLWRMTGGFWPSALVAALFAVHPLRVESVAWISERKDVLSGLLFVLSLAAYVRYVRSPFSLGRYVLLAVVFALGLMAKPMLVTLPAVLLLLDYWPLGRFPFRWQLVIEKVPLLLLAVVSCLVTIWAQGSAAALNRHISLGDRISNALVAYVAYLVQLFWPVGLAAYYPHPEGDLPVWKVFGSLVVLVCLSLGAVVYRRRCPYLLVGWLWYVGMLAPVSGVVLQAGGHAMADRFTYLPQMGIYLALAWGIAEACRSWPYRRWLCGVGSALALAVLMGCAWRQTCFWSNSEMLWTHALAHTASNCVSHNNLGNALIREGRVKEAIAQYRQALEVNDDYSEAHNNLGNALAGQGRFDEALAHYRKSLEIQPNYAEAYYNLGNLLGRLERFDEAIVQFQRALAITDYPEAHNNLGNVLAQRGRFEEALAQYQRALELRPKFADAHWNLGNAYSRRGQMEEALAHLRQAVELKPDFAIAQCDLGVALAKLGQLNEALPCFQKALESKPDLVDAYDGLGTVLSRLGRHEEALHEYRKALKIAPHDATAHSRLAWLLATCPEPSFRNGAEAIEHAERANQVCGGKRPDVLDALAAGYAEAGWFPEALAAARKALELATQQDKRALAEGLRARIALYENKRPYRQQPK